MIPGRLALHHGSVITFNSGNALLSYLTSKTSTNASSTGGNSGSAAVDTKAITASSQAALKAAGSTVQASSANRALDKQQAALAADLRAAMGKANVKLAGTVEFSVGSDGSVSVKGSDADKAAATAFLKADASQPGFASRIATQARDALALSSSIQQRAAISQAARHAGKSGNVMALYTSLLQQSNTSTAVFSLSSGASALTYPGSLSTNA